jgi:hypothetical protein
MYSVTSVILPGVGSVCPECFSRGHIAAFPLTVREVYSFGITQPPSQLDWDVDAARALVAARPRSPLKLDRTWLRHWLTERTSVTAGHLDHIPPDRLEEPCLLVEIMAGAPGDMPEPFRILIDGTHRAARQVRDGRDVWCYLLTELEHRSVCTYTRDGCVTDIPTLPGPGITAQDAGIFDDRA